MIAVEKQAEVERFAQQLFAQETDWVRFYREVLGLQGVVRQMFPRQEELAAFKRTDAYRGILQLLSQLRAKRVVAEACDEPTRVITVRLPQSMHEALQAEAYEHHTSVNKLCISKLLQVVDNSEDQRGLQ
jgi:predicted HicB family RNase H-like nuclease